MVTRFNAVAPDPAYAASAPGGDNPVSKQIRSLELAGYGSEAAKQFIMRTDPKDHAARLAEANTIRVHIHLAAKNIGEIKGCIFDPEHVFALALKSGLTVKQVTEEIINIYAQNDVDTHTDTSRRVVTQNNEAVYTARAAQVANHGR